MIATLIAIVACLFVIAAIFAKSWGMDKRSQSIERAAERDALAAWLRQKRNFTLRDAITSALGQNYVGMTTGERLRISNLIRREFGCYPLGEPEGRPHPHLWVNPMTSELIKEMRA